jgi:hypothetical protein
MRRQRAQLGDSRELQVRRKVADQLAVCIERIKATSVAEQAAGIAVAVEHRPKAVNLVLQIFILS